MFPGTENRYWDNEIEEIKYQIGNGCEIDQVVGQWHANLCGLGEIFDNSMVKSSLRSVYKYNFKPVMRNTFNAWRVFCLNGESGTVMCEYPKDVERPTITISYGQECMTGFEYQVAAHMISEGMMQQGLELIRAVRNRYDGEKRNPWNEIECGSNYARSMASYSLIPIFSGFLYDIPKGMIGFNPIVKNELFRSIWSVASGWGIVEITPDQFTMKIHAGYLDIKQVNLPYLHDQRVIFCADGVVKEIDSNHGILLFEKMRVKHGITVSISN